MFYEKGKTNSHKTVDYLWDKLIKKQLILKIINYLGKTYINLHLTRLDDSLTLFFVFYLGNSYKYINEIGYIYFSEEPNSLTNINTDNSKKYNKVYHDILWHFKILYDKTSNNKKDKNMVRCIVKQFFGYFSNKIKYLTVNFELANEVLNKIINNKFYNFYDKYKVKKWLKKINRRNKEL